MLRFGGFGTLIEIGFAPIKWRGMYSACCQFFELCRAEIVER